MSLTRVVLIEDDLASQFMVTEVLVNAFKTVDMRLAIAATVASLEDARKALTQLGTPSAPTVVLVDLHLPDSEGIATWEQLAEEFPALNLIAFSGDVTAVKEIVRRGGIALDKAKTHELPGLILDLTT